MSAVVRGAGALMLLSSLLSAQIISPDRLGSWAQTGVYENATKGIPRRDVVFCNVRIAIPGSPLAARGDGVRDDSDALQAALKACPPGEVVFLPRGTYRITRPLVIDKGIVVRGEGPAATEIVQGAPQAVFQVQGSSTSFWYAAVGGHPELGIVQAVRSGGDPTRSSSTTPRSSPRGTSF
jgi:hypothetical protein